MPSANRNQLAVLALAAVIAVTGLTGCETTQDKAAAHRAEAERILKAREKRQEEKAKNREEKG